ncbi:restriction endonuclease subunit M, partial [Escherichia coli]|nr:restriction endonuclease subunit M [Escherichia coli]EFN7267653.1 restriction endonuclease subunit M [Escherichia coli O21]
AHITFKHPELVEKLNAVLAKHYSVKFHSSV